MSKLIKGSEARFNRLQLPGIQFARDFDDLVNNYDLMKLIGQSRAIYHNNPLVKNAIDTKASYSIGNAFEYRSLSKNIQAKLKLDAAIKQWSKVCEVSGKTLNDVQWLASTLVDVDGECYILLSETKEGYPVFQLIEAHAINSRQAGKIDRGALIEEKGVLYDKKTKRPIQYRILANEEKNDTLVSVQNIIRIAEPAMSVRSNPLIASCMRTVQDLEHSQELLLTQHLLATVMSIVEHNETGDNGYITDDSSVTGDFKVETINQEGGEVRYYKANTGSKLEFLTNTNPSLPWQEYQDILFNQICLALNWPKTFLGDNTGTGVNDRLSIAQAAKTCKDRQTLFMPFFIRLCNYAIAKMVKNGYLDIDLPEDWYLAYMTTPRSVTVDLARDSKALQEEYKLNFKTLGQIIGDDGREVPEHMLERLREEALFIKLREQVENEYQVKLDPTNVRLLSPNQFQATTPPTESHNESI